MRRGAAPIQPQQRHGVFLVLLYAACVEFILNLHDLNQIVSREKYLRSMKISFSNIDSDSKVSRHSLW